MSKSSTSQRKVGCRDIYTGVPKSALARALRSGKRADALMSLIQSAKLSRHDPYPYLKDVMERLPTQRASEVVELCLFA